MVFPGLGDTRTEKVNNNQPTKQLCERKNNDQIRARLESFYIMF